MALIGNYSAYLKNPATYIGGVQVSNVRNAFNESGQNLQMYYGESQGGGLPFTASLPTGTQPPFSYHFADKGGEMSSTTQITGTGSMSSSMANGINIISTINGSGTIDTAGLSLVTSMIATIAGSGSLTGNMVGAVQMAADLAGSGAVTASLKMLSGLIADLSGSGAISADLKGKLFMEANIYVNEGAATVDQIIQGVVEGVGTITATVPELLNTETGDIIIPLD